MEKYVTTHAAEFGASRAIVLFPSTGPQGRASENRRMATFNRLYDQLSIEDPCTHRIAMLSPRLANPATIDNSVVFPAITRDFLPNH